MVRQRERKPPLEIEEIKEKFTPKLEREEPQQGELSYVNRKGANPIDWGGSKRVKDTPSDKRGTGRFSNPRTRLILTMLVPVVLAAIMIFQFAPNKVEVRNLQLAVQTLSEQVNDLRTRLEVHGW